MNTLSALASYLRTVNADEEGASMVEYGLLISFIALAVIAVLTLLGPAIAGMFQGVLDAI